MTQPCSRLPGQLLAWVALLALLPGRVEAGGIQLSERGTRALGRGGASIVGSDTLNASYLNPAGLLRSKGWTASVDVALVDYAVAFTRYPDPLGEDQDCCSASSSNIRYLNPSVGLSWGPEQGSWVAALYVYGPYAGAVDFPERGDARYLIVDQDNGLAYAQLSAAWQPLRSLRLGLGLQLREFWMRQQVMVSVYPGFIGAAEDPEFDGLLDVRVEDWWNPGFVAGLIWEPVERLELGFSYQSGMDVDAEGTMLVEIPAHYLFAQMEQSGRDVHLRTRLPDMLRFGVRWTEPERWDLELDLVWERWSQHTAITATPAEDIRFTNVPGLGDYTVKTISVPDVYQDSVSLRIGGDYHVSPGRLRLRAGVFLESGAVPDESANPGSLDSNKIGFGLGLTATVWGLELDAGYGHLFMQRRDITTSERRQVNPLYPDPQGDEGPTVVGNGLYEAGLDIVSLAAIWRY